MGNDAYAAIYDIYRFFGYVSSVEEGIESLMELAGDSNCSFDGRVLRLWEKGRRLKAELLWDTDKHCFYYRNRKGQQVFYRHTGSPENVASLVNQIKRTWFGNMRT